VSRYAIVGGGVAGVTAARDLAERSSSAKDEIHIYNTESYPYYPRPLLWKFIAGEMEDKEDLYFQPLSWYGERGIQFHVGTEVAALDPEAHHLTLKNGDLVTYDRLLLACGARPLVPPVDGVDKEGVFTLRSLDDAKAIKAYAGGVARAVVIGGGLLGLETALALRQAGPAVHVIEIAEHLLPRQLDREGARVLRGLLEGLGLEITTGALVEAILGDGRVEGARIKDGRVVDGELVLFSAGIRCRAKLAHDAGLQVNRGAVVDEQMRTSAVDVFAAGDVAEFGGMVQGIIPAAVDQAKVAAANMAEGGSTRYAGTLPTTILKVAGAEVASLGEYNPEDSEASGSAFRVVRRADADRGFYSKFVLRDGRIVGAILLNEPRRAAMARLLIDRETDVSEHADHLVDDDFDLRSLL
jgi:nitrite reductase (NADH) large subunit